MVQRVLTHGGNARSVIPDLIGPGAVSCTKPKRVKQVEEKTAKTAHHNLKPRELGWGRRVWNPSQVSFNSRRDKIVSIDGGKVLT